MKTVLFAFLFLLVTGCVSTRQILFKNQSKVNIILLNSTSDSSQVFGNYQKKLDTLLQKASIDNNSFSAIYHSDSIKTEYTVNVKVDSIILISYDIQKEKLKIKDQINKELSEKQAEYEEKQVKYDTSNGYLTTEQRVIGSIAATAVMNAVIMPMGFIGFVIIGDEQESTRSSSNRDDFERANFKPKIKGSIEIVDNLKSMRLWKKEITTEYKYGRYVTYEEQTDMLFIMFLADLRFDLYTKCNFK